MPVGLSEQNIDKNTSTVLQRFYICLSAPSISAGTGVTILLIC